MMLNCQDLVARLFETIDPREALSITPRPIRKEVEEGGASIDLHLGRWFSTMRQSNIALVEMTKDQHAVSKEHFVAFDGSFILHPGKFVLGITLEWIALPGNLAGLVTGKSSLGRRGLIIETASGIQPGFAGCLTLELANVGEIPIELRPGMKICQIFLTETKSYHISAKSQFKGSRKPGLGSAI